MYGPFSCIMERRKDVKFKKEPKLNFRKRRSNLNHESLKEWCLWIVEIILVIFTATVLVLSFGNKTSVIGYSMSPSLENDEEVLIDKFMYKLINPKREDLVVFLPNGNPKSHYYIRRIVALPGDRVQVKEGFLYINGETFDEKDEYPKMQEAGLAENEITLGEDEYFVLGDNRNNSEDSRSANIGVVKKEYMVGRAWFRTSPFKKMGFL